MLKELEPSNFYVIFFHKFIIDSIFIIEECFGAILIKYLVKFYDSSFLDAIMVS